MGDRRREDDPHRLRPFKAWAVVSYQGRMVTSNGDETDELAGLAIYPRRYLAAMVASTNPEWRVVPVGVRSLQHRKR